MHITHSSTVDTAQIRIAGLREPVRMLHISDTHVAMIDDRDEDCKEASRDKIAKRVGSLQSLVQLLKKAERDDYDLVALSGDIIEFATHAAVDHAAGAIDTLDIPVMYTSGNHDWLLPKTPPDDVRRREGWARLKPLYRDRAEFDHCEIAGLDFLCVDNSTYQIEEEQLAFVQTHLANGQPTVIFMHIPMSLPTLRDPTIAKWGNPILLADPDWSIQGREKWYTTVDRPVTVEFAKTLATADNLVAVFCGHIHFDHADTISRQAVQYVVAPGFYGGCREVQFLPL